MKRNVTNLVTAVGFALFLLTIGRFVQHSFFGTETTTERAMVKK